MSTWSYKPGQAWLSLTANSRPILIAVDAIEAVYPAHTGTREDGATITARSGNDYRVTESVAKVRELIETVLGVQE
ncbi:hypothetical protein DS6A_90 [Mycobacterium phage DS6A]|uniref:Uncharacterized protein n=1 Tax=Mycobacterium phage DS6A TaxID=45764 RepID=G8I4K0_9CAUD|nr:hypothetical protein DS6A_90 [Mycobacterium phage DS6A]AER47644.1 hypothetical protein DS6A_90 [Mycobacterium phage DS6A]